MKYQILIVDDNRDLADNMKDIFTDHGYDSTIALTGKKALHICREKHFDLGLIDMRLPDTDGLSLIEELSHVCPTMGDIIIITGYGSLESAVEAVRQKRIVSYEMKPVKMERLLALIRQIFEKREAENQLKEYQEHLEELVHTRTQELEKINQEIRKLSLAVEQSPATVVITDIDGRIEYVNPTFTAISGYTFEEALGQNPRILKSGQTRTSVYKALWETILAGNVWKGELLNKRKNGELFWETCWVSPLLNDHGVIEHFVAVKLDITAKKETERELLVAKEKAEQATRAKSAFLANMSHEIRTPMNAVLGYGQLMERDESLPEVHKSSLKAIIKSGRHLLKLINEILELSKIEAGHKELQLTNFDLREMLNDLNTMLSIQAREKGLKFEICYRTPIRNYIKTDQQKLRQILINLFSNALKFTGTGEIILSVETVDTSASAGSIPWKQSPLEKGRVMLQFTMKDTGIGISENEQAIVFKTFEQAEAGRESQEGTGLGLAISHQYAILLGGEMHLKSELGNGSEFSFFVVADEVDEAELEPALESIKILSLKPEYREKRILIADDIESNRLFLKTMLEEVGFIVALAGDGQKAVDLCHSFHPHLIMMDLRMPVMNGLEATRIIRQKYDVDKLPIVGVTASVFADEQHLFTRAGMNDIILKPFEGNQILNKIAELLDLEYYQETTGNSESNTPRVLSASLLPNNLASIPREMQNELKKNIERGYLDNILSILAQIKVDQPVLADALKQMVSRFAYDELLKLLEDNNDRSN